MARTPTTAPTRKALAGGIGAGVGDALSGLLIYLFETAARVDMPDRVEGYISLLFNVGMAILFAYFTPPATDEIPKPD